MKNVSESIKSREEMFGLRDTLLQEQWKKDDDKARLVREQREAELRQLEEESRMSSMQEDLQMRMQRLQLERDAKVWLTYLVHCIIYLFSLPVFVRHTFKCRTCSTRSINFHFIIMFQ